MTKEQLETKIDFISNNKPKEVTFVEKIALMILLLGCLGGVIFLIFGFFIPEFKYIPITLAIVCFFNNFVIFVVLRGFAAIITNTYKTSEYTKIQVEKLADTTANTVKYNSNNNDLPIML